MESDQRTMNRRTVSTFPRFWLWNAQFRPPEFCGREQLLTAAQPFSCILLFTHFGVL